jgi:hypothetical protein
MCSTTLQDITKLHGTVVSIDQELILKASVGIERKEKQFLLKG